MEHDRLGCKERTLTTLANEDVWRHLLQHAWQPLDYQVVCKLLCCSQAIMAVVHRTCSGRLSVRVQQQQSSSKQHEGTLQIAKWLARHQQLVCELILDTDSCGPKQHVLVQPQDPQHAATTTQAGRCNRHNIFNNDNSALAALQHKLRRLASRVSPPGPAVPPIPTSSAISSLTRLEWAVSSCSKPRQVIKGLRHLHALRSLALTCLDSGSGPAAFEDLAPTVQALTGLTSLQLQHFSISKATTQLFPPSLRTLSLGAPLPRLYACSMREQHLQLQHLTALQQLQLHSLKGCDVLPAGVQSLQVEHCTVLPLLRLQHLRVLTITADVPESVLGQLSVLQQLEQLHLTYRSWALSDAGTSFLQQLPLRSLHCCMPAQQLPALGAFGGKLMQLQLKVQAVQDINSESLQGLLAQHLLCLTAVQALSVQVQALLESQQTHQQLLLPAQAAGDASSSGPSAAATVATREWTNTDSETGCALAAALCSLPVLTSLELEGFQLGPAAAAQLASATQLTHLQLPAADCGSMPNAAARTATADGTAAAALEAAAAGALDSKVAAASAPAGSQVTVVVHHD